MQYNPLRSNGLVSGDDQPFRRLMQKQKFCSLFSGGKDSTMALYRALRIYDVPLLLSMIPEDPESYMYHVPNINLTKYSAEAIGIPIIARRTSGKPPQENLDLKNALEDLKKEFEIEGVVAGAVRSNYQYNIISKICRELDIKVFAPYWQHSHEDLIREAIDAGFEILIVGVYADGFDESWLGRKLDLDALEELKKLNRKFGIDIGGEGGEYETFVVNGPIFKKRIEILKSKKEWDGVRGEFIIERVELTDKKNFLSGNFCARKTAKQFLGPISQSEIRAQLESYTF